MSRYYLLTLLFAGILLGSMFSLNAQPCPALPTLLIDTAACEGSIIDLNAIAGGTDPSTIWHDQAGNDYPDGSNVLLNSNGSCDPVLLSFNNLYINNDGCEIMSHVIEVTTYPAIGIVDISQGNCSVDISVPCSNFDIVWQDLQGVTGTGSHYEGGDPAGTIITFTVTNPLAIGTDCEGISMDYLLECSLFPCDPIAPLFIETNACNGDVVNLTEMGSGAQGSVWYDLNTDLPVNDPTSVALSGSGCDAVLYNFYAPYTNICNGNTDRDNIFIYVYPAASASQSTALCGAAITQDCPWFSSVWTDDSGQSGTGFTYSASPGQSGTVTFTVSNSGSPFDCGGTSLDVAYSCPTEGCLADAGTVTGDVFICNNAGISEATFVTTGTSPAGYEYTLLLTNGDQILKIGSPINETPDIHDVTIDFSDLLEGNGYCLQSLVYEANNPPAGLAVGNSLANLSGSCFDIGACKTIDVFNCLSIALTTDMTGEVLALESGEPIEPADPLAGISITADPAHGSVTLQDNGDIVYFPDEGYVGTDEFILFYTNFSGQQYGLYVAVDVVSASGVCQIQPIEVCTPPQTPVDICLSCVQNGVFIFNVFQPTFPCSIEIQAACINYTPLPGMELYSPDSIVITYCNTQDPTDCLTTYALINIGECSPEPSNQAPVANNDAANSNGSAVNINVTANDSDPDGDPLTVSNYTQPAHGTVVLNGNSFTYTPDSGFEGTDTFTYQVCDPEGLCDQATVTINVNLPTPACNEPDNLCLEVFPDFTTFCLEFCNLSGNVIDITAAHTTFDCSLDILDNNCIKYTPLPGFSGDDLVEIIGCNQAGECDTVYVNVQVGNCGGTPTNQAPVANNDAANSNGSAVNINVTANDSDPDGDPLTVSNYTQPAHGTVVLNGNSFTYTPDSGFEGTDTFTYQVCDPEGLCDQATVTINVNLPTPACNEPDNLCLEVFPDFTTFCLEFCNLSGNVIDITAAHTTFDCSLDILDNNCIKYTPLPGFSGDDLVEIIGCNQAGECDTVYVNVQVGNCGGTPTNQAPVANNDAANSNGSTVNINVTANDSDPDGDPLTVSNYTQPAHGTVVLNGNSFTYTPDSGFEGTDTFTYQVCDPEGLCDQATVTINVNLPEPSNQAPVANNDAANSNGSAVNINVTANDSDPDGDPLTVSTYTQPAHGTVVLNGNSFTYTPNSGFEGTDTFTYQVCDPEGLCDQATVTINVSLPATGCENVTYLCTGAATPEPICPEFCNLPAGSDYYIALGITNYNCLLSLAGEDCLQYAALPLFSGQEHLMVVACTMLGICDTAHVYIQVTGCDDGGGIAPSYPGEGKYIHNFEQTQATALTLNGNIWPQPAQEYASLSFSAAKDDILPLTLFDMTGRKIQQSYIVAQKGQNTLTINTTHLSAGIYIVQLGNGHTTTSTLTSKFVKQ